VNRFRSFLRTSLIGGIVVVLPVAILIAVFKWIFNFVTGLIRPITDVLIQTSEFTGVLADIIVLAVILVVCFLIGVIVKTGIGKWAHTLIDTRLLSIAPGYNMIKETVLQLFGGKKAPLSRVALVELFANEVMTTAFITDENPDGTFTVFVPNSPSPLSGNLYHLKSRYVHPVDMTVEQAMRTIISFGAGSSDLVAARQKKTGQR
jgi:uncharacterized membrane protein